MCVKVRSVKGLDSDRLKPSVEGSRLRRAFSTYATDRIHTHTHAVVCSGCQCGLQPIITPCRNSQANQTGLALPRTLQAQRLDLHKSSELLHKCFLWGNPFHGRVSGQMIKQRA